MMASTNQRKAFISHKLTFLKDQGDHFINDVGLYINGIIKAGETWTEGEDNKIGYMELGQMIDSAVVFLSEKCEILAGLTVGVEANPVLQASGEQSDKMPLSTATLGVASPSSLRQSVGPEASATEVSYRQLREADESTGSCADQMKPVIARIDVIEEALCFLRSNSEKVAEQQSGIDQQLKALLLKLLELDKSNNLSIRKVKEKISEISDTQVTLDQENETRLQSLEQQLHTLSAAQDKLNVEMEFQTEAAKTFFLLPDQLESVKEKLGVMEVRIQRIIEDCSYKLQDIENVTRDLAKNVLAKTDTAKIISASQDQKMTLLKELETRLQTLEADNGRHWVDVQKLVEKGETNFRILSQMLKNRLSSLEQLRTCLSKKAMIRDDNIKKLTRVVQDVAILYPRLQQLELKSTKTRCGFTARAMFSTYPKKLLRPYKNVYTNVGGNFNADSGKFKAPVDGLYVTSVSLYLSGDGMMEVSVKYEEENPCDFIESATCTSVCEVKGSHACSVGVVEMKADETLYVSVKYGRTDLAKSVQFSCFLLVGAECDEGIALLSDESQDDSE